MQKRNNYITKCCLLIFVVLLSTMAYTIYNVKTELNKLILTQDEIVKDRIASYKMYSGLKTIQDSKAEWGINGLYGDGYYCVSYTSDKNDTVDHERCHAQIDYDYYHFCDIKG